MLVAVIRPRGRKRKGSVFRFASSESGQTADISACPLCARFRHGRRQAFCVLSPTGSVFGWEVSATRDLMKPATRCARACICTIVTTFMISGVSPSDGCPL